MDGAVGQVDPDAGGAPAGSREGEARRRGEGAEVEPAVAELVLAAGEQRAAVGGAVRGVVHCRRAQQLCRRGRRARAAQGLPRHQAGVGCRPHPVRLPRIPGRLTRRHRQRSRRSVSW